MRLRSALPPALVLGAVLGAVSGRLERSDPVFAAVEPVPGDAAAASWDIPVVHNDPVQRFVGLFAEEQSDRMALYLKRSGRYEAMIRSKLRERGMPEDLFYLSMIESGLDPTARSTASAVGLWQFVEGTARRYGLRVDAHVDERRHPERATDAALAYLSDLHRHFGSWYLAAAAYNTGEGRVSRIMREVTGSERGTDDDYWRIRWRLPAETREYVPLLVAAALVGKEPRRYGLTGVARWAPVETEEVEAAPGTPLATIAAAAGLDEAALRRLNPHLLQGVTPPGGPYPVAIPVGRGERYAAEVDALRAREAEARRVAEARAAERARAEAARVRRHTVRNGESLWIIARRYDTSVRSIQSANGMGSRSRIRPGERLVIPS